MANWYVSSVRHAAIAQWSAGAAISLGAYRRQLAAVVPANGRVFKCTTAGTTGGSEPTWNLNNNGTTNDGTVVWTQVGGQEAEQVASNWKAALPTVISSTALTTTGDVVYVASDHAESSAANLMMGSAEIIVCVNEAGSLPPVAADLATGAVVEITGSFAFTFNSNYTSRGIKWKVGTGSTSSLAGFNLIGDQFHENCEFEIASTNASAYMSIGPSSTGGGYCEWKNVKFTAANVAQCPRPIFSEFLWRDTATPFGGATIPTAPVGASSANGARPIITLRNLDLSAITGNIFSSGLTQHVLFENCKLSSTVTMTGLNGVSNTNVLRLNNCDDGTNNAGFNFREEGYTTLVTIDGTVYAAGGASNGVTPYSHLFTPKSGNAVSQSTLLRVAKRVNTINAAKTFTVNALLFAAAAPVRASLFCEFNINDDASSPVGTLHSTRSSFMDQSAVESATVDWSGGQPLRTNSTSRPIGYMFSVASNPGRVFRVTTSGVTAASEPANYATAVDGDSFSDGGAVVKVLYRVKFSVTATPRRRAVMFARPFAMLSTVDRLWIDPKIRIT